MSATTPTASTPTDDRTKPLAEYLPGGSEYDE